MTTETSNQELKLNAEWTNDCQGKKDYDGDILSICTRYWPRGGSALELNTANGNMTDGSDPKRQREIKPSANSSLILRHGDFNYIELISKEFEAETEEEVKSQVEQWAQEQMNTVVSILRDHFTF